MSVEKSKQGDNKFNLFDKTSRMASYTLHITKNPNVFDPENSRDILAEIRKTAVRIHVLCWRANDIRVPVKDNRKQIEARNELQDQALRYCTDLKALINLAKPLYHVSGKKTRNWMKKVLEVQSLISNWRDSDRGRIK